jgi:hypothetical protein
MANFLNLLGFFEFLVQPGIGLLGLCAQRFKFLVVLSQV